MEEKKPESVLPQVVPPANENDISFQDIQDLDLEKFKEGMLRGIYATSTTLFQQAGFENKRLGSMREMIGFLESDLFTKEQFQKMTPKEKIQIYSIMTSNMSMSLGFLQDLHKNVAASLETLNNLQRIKSEKPAEKTTSNVDRVKLEGFKRMLESKIRERVDQKKNT